VWNKDTKDLVALATHKREGDAFTRWVVRALHSILRLYYNYTGIENHKHLKDGTYYYSNKHLNRLSRNITISIASVVPTASILALYYISSQFNKILFSMLFSLFFTAVLAIFTSASKVEIFLGVMTLAAVQVVFIAGNNYP